MENKKVIECLKSLCEKAKFGDYAFSCSNNNLNIHLSKMYLEPDSYITIGGLRWMNYNLYYNDGGDGLFYPDNNILNVVPYGYYYTWQAVQRILLLYPNWRLPTFEEINSDLFDASGNNFNKIKSIGLDYWNAANGTNELLFNLKGAGYKFNSTYSSFKNYGFLWTSTLSMEGKNYAYGARAVDGISIGCNLSIINELDAGSLRLVQDI